MTNTPLFRRGRGAHFIKRVYLVRCAGLAVGSLCVGSVLITQHARAGLLVALATYCWGWPHLAYWRARRHAIPIAAERQNMMVDSLLSGVWAGALHFQLLPSILVVLMFSINNVSVGGVALLWWGSLVSTLGVLAGGAIFGFTFVLATSASVTLACLPILVFYPLLLGKSVYDTANQLALRSATLKNLSERDQLTGLLNRHSFSIRLNDTLATLKNEKGRLSVLFIDVDDFKTINDALGHSVGDELLTILGTRFAELVLDRGVIGRYGGDEFVAFTLDSSSELADAVLSLAVIPFFIAGRELFISASIGISRYPEDGDDSGMLLQKADIAMYSAKIQGSNNYQFYSESLNLADSKLDLSTRLHKAFNSNCLFVQYQPQLDMQTGLITGVEALVRWKDVEQGMVPPDIFIPIAETTGLIHQIGEWVLASACRQNRSWQDAGLPAIRVSVNLSPVQLGRAGIINTIQGILQDTGLPASMLELEVTEGAIMRNPEESAAILDQLRSAGVSIALDDFGTGYSNLGFLKKFKLDRIKIDSSFIGGIGENEDDEAIIVAMIALARALGVEVVAEGVENMAQRLFLMSHGCKLAQGFYYSAAVDGSEITAMLRASQHT